MMDPQILRELETAAQILLASPDLVTNEQRHAAESVFLNFKKTKSPYSLCIQILETTKIDYVLFEVAGLVKEALIREWSFLQENDIASLRQYLLRYVIDRPTLPLFVREKILQVIAIMIKRGSIEDCGNNRKLLLGEVEQFIMNGNHSQKLLGCCLLAAIIQEYAVTTKSSDIGLSLETHIQAKQSFELKDLKRIFQFCCRVLSTLSSEEHPFSNEALSLIKHLLSISESILSWNFVSPTFLDSFRHIMEKMDENVAFKPAPCWKEIILDPQVVNLFFTVYWKIRMSPQLSHHALTCLIQLATVDGRVFSGSEKADYRENYLKAFIKLITSIDILDREALGISNIVKKLFYPFDGQFDMEKKLNQEFFDHVTRLTCNFAEGAANEETMYADDRLYMEAFDHMMEAWMRALFNWQSSPNRYCKQAFQQIFNVYLKCHLSAPHGTRGQGRDLEPEELDESDEIDRIKFRTQLHTIGGFGQHVPEYCLPVLARLMEDRTKVLEAHLEKLSQQGPTISDSNSLVMLFEDIHWLLLISGNVVFLESNEGTPRIPEKLMVYSVAQSSVTNVEVSLRVFGSPNRDFSDIEGAEEKTDHILRLIASVFRLSHLLKKFIEAKLMQFLSPEVVSSLLWFFREWSASYLLPDEWLYTEMSMPLLYAFGRDSEGGVWTINYLLEQVVTYFMCFNFEPGVVQDAAKLFVSLTDGKEKSACVLKSESLSAIMSAQSRLPQVVKGEVYRGLTAAIAYRNEESWSEYWQRIMKPLQDRWRAIVSHENFNRIYQEEQIKTEIMEILDCLTGVVNGSRIATAEIIYQYLTPTFSELPSLMAVYRNYQQVVELVFGFFNACAKNLIMNLVRSRDKEFYESCIQTIQTYVKCNLGRFSLDSDSQEETFDDIFLLLDLLTNLLPRYYLALEDIPPEAEQMVPVDVCLFGLNLIMPLMTANLFKHPSLFLKYYKFIVSTSELCPEKICRLPESLLKNILTSVELGLTVCGQEIFPLCCDFLQFVGTHISKMNGAGEPGRDILKPFLKLLLDLILSRQINSEHLPSTGSAFLALVLCYQDYYRSLVQALLDAQTDPAIKDRLAKAFIALTNHIMEKKNRVVFRSKFDEFISKTHGFLHVK